MSKNSLFRHPCSRAALSLAASFVALSGCVTPPDDAAQQDARPQPDTVSTARQRPRPAEPVVRDDAASLPAAGQPAAESSSPEQQIVPRIADRPAATSPAAAAPKPKSTTVDAVVPPLPLPQFVDLVFGDMLGVPYTLGAGAAERSDLIQLRSSGRLSSADFLELVSSGLKSYGISVTLEKGSYLIVEDKALKSQMPRFIHARANSGTPSDLRPIVTFVELRAVSANDMLVILQKTFPGSDVIKFDANPRLNTITMIGLSRDVDAALAVVAQMDELTYAGTEVERYKPTYWVAGDLAKELNRLLSAEGWQSTDNTAVTRTLTILPITFSNDLVIFAKEPAAMARARFWLSELDRPSQAGDTPQLFVYQVRNVDAKVLADTLNSVRGPRSTAAQAAGAAAPGAGAPPADVGFRPSPSGAAAVLPQGGIVVDVGSNQLIFSGTPSAYNQLLPLLQQLDRPPGEVLIQVSIIEVALTDETRLGVEFLADALKTGGSDYLVDTGTSGNGFQVSTDDLGLGSSGLNLGVVSGDVEATLNAFARNNQINVLSRPRLIARSGSAAQIQVGTDVPIVTSQRAAEAQDGGGETDVLQSIQYRSTGVLLSIEPIIFSQNRVNLKISQEVSTAIAPSGGIASPRISTRNVNTELSLEDGETVILGGLMQSETVNDSNGVPFLKDVPLLGGLFSSQSSTVNKTELLVLISAYILRGPDDKAYFTDMFIDHLNTTSRNPANLTTQIPSEERFLVVPRIDE